MIEYVVAENIDSRSLRKAVQCLEAGGLVAWPTDSSWSLGCSVQSKVGLEKLRALKSGQTFLPTLTCSSISQFSEYAILDSVPFRLVKRHVPGPFVFILEPTPALEKKLGLKRAELGVRLPAHPVPVALVEALGLPLLSITAVRSMTDPDWDPEADPADALFEFGADVEDIPGVELVLDTGEPLPPQLTTVVSLLQDEPQILRQGIGEL